MTPEDYLKESAKTLAEQDETQRTLDRIRFQDALEIADAGNVCDTVKREIFYKDTKASERWRKQHVKICEIRNNIPDIINLSQHDTDILHAGLGIGSEAGEVMEAIIKGLTSDNDNIDPVNIKEEVGDILWYIAILCRRCGFTFEEAMETNIDKLKTRFPNNFTTDDAKNRDLDKEREVLEK